jgi:hypothetical protein
MFDTHQGIPRVSPLSKRNYLVIPRNLPLLTMSESHPVSQEYPLPPYIFHL